MTTPKYDKAVGTRIRDRRKALELELTPVAAAIGCSVAQLSRYEHGDTSAKPETLVALAKVLKCSAADFLKGIEGPK